MKVKFERKTYYQNDDFKVYLENINDQVFIHVGIDKATKEVFSLIKQVFAEVAIKMYFLGYEELFAYTKDNRIVKLIGGAEYLDSHQGYEVWKWELN